jgi:hypothetical protein
MSFTEIEFYVEASEAMAPAIKEGNIVVINTGNSSFYSIAVGDVIIYYNYDIDRVHVGRVADIQIYPTGEGRQVGKSFIIKYDNPVYDEEHYLQSEEDYIGKVIYVLPSSFGVLNSPIVWIIIAAIVSVGLYYRNKRKRKSL